jgi:hypothetical protein
MKIKLKSILPITILWLCATSCLAENSSVAVTFKKEPTEAGTKQFFLDSKDNNSKVNPEKFNEISNQNRIKDSSSSKAKEGMLDKFWNLKIKEKAFILAALAIVPIFLWGIMKFAITGKQFSDKDFTVTEKIFVTENSYIEARKYINSGKIFYLAEGDFPNELKGGISRETYEKLKNSTL